MVGVGLIAKTVCASVCPPRGLIGAGFWGSHTAIVIWFQRELLGLVPFVEAESRKQLWGGALGELPSWPILLQGSVADPAATGMAGLAGCWTIQYTPSNGCEQF